MGDVDLVAFHQRFADCEAFGQLERVRHCTADQDGIGLFQQAIDHLDLIGDLRAAEDHYERGGG